MVQEVKDAISKWRKVHSKKGVKAWSNIAVSKKKNKKDDWNLDTAVAVYMTHDFSFFITPNLDYQITNIEIVDNIILKT